MGKRKRSRADYEERQQGANLIGMGQTLSVIRGSRPDHPTDQPESTESDSAAKSPPSRGDEEGWQKVEGRATKKQRKLPSKETGNYPEIKHSASARLQTHVKTTDLQNLVLYLVADGTAPQWVAIRHHGAIRKVVVLMVPGLEAGMFNGKIPLVDTKSEESPENTKLEAASEEDEGSVSPKEKERRGKGRQKQGKIPLSPDDYYPVALDADKLAHPLKPLADMFPHVWPIKAPGDSRYMRVHSPMAAMLTAPLPKSKEEKKRKGPAAAREVNGWTNVPTPITAFLATFEELEDSEFVLHPALYPASHARDDALQKRRIAKQAAEDGWKDTLVDSLEDGIGAAEERERGSLTAGREVLCMDCEMCKTSETAFELTRISIVRWDGSVVMDELVKPESPITDYLTPYSGITEAMLKPVTTTLSDIQARLLELITPSTILVGHSLNADLTALKLTHPFIIDTSLIYPHPRGPPLRSSLKWLAQKYLSREIQQHHGSSGHDSIEDARACLGLVKQKCERGPAWGTNEATSESIFKRLRRSHKPSFLRTSGANAEFRTGAVVDWGDPRRGFGSAADVCIGCKDDADVVEGIRVATNGGGESGEVPITGVDFVWGRLRELEAVRGWWSKSKTADNDELRHNAIGEAAGEGSPCAARLTAAVSRTVARISQVHASLPPCSAFIVYSGTGDPRDLARLQALQRQFKEEYAVKKWDQLSVRWTDVEEQALRQACQHARDGIGFVGVK